MNSNELKDKLLNNSDQIMDKLLYLLSGNDDAVINPWEREAINTLYPTLHNIMINTSDLKKIDAKNSGQVLDALSKGKITPDQALKLMTMLRTQFEFEQLPEMMNKIEDM